jgi:p-cumate 2,3-dioxygenase subunit alpha
MAEGSIGVGRAATAGAPLIIDEHAEGIFRVNRSVFVEEAILALERERIFDRCWLYLGHASEVASPASFVTREVGGRALLFNRDRDGALQAFYNTCAHRGALVCRERAGRRRAFQCPYHGWIYDERGKLIEVPGRSSLPEAFNADGTMNLARVPKCAEYRGFVFVCFDRDAVSLEEYLAGARAYLDYVADQGERGMEIVGGAQEYSVAANWKLLQENSADGYHAATTHATYFDYIRGRDGNRRDFDPSITFGRVRNLGNGHAVSESVGAMPWGRPYARWVPGWGQDARPEVEALAQGIVARLGEERGTIVARGDRNLLIFPNLVVNDIMAITVRTFYPRRPDHMDVNAWSLAPIGESAASRERRLRNFLEFLGPGGFATPDDVEMLELCQRGYANRDGIAWNDLSRGMQKELPAKSDELQMRCFWRRWHQLVTGCDGAVNGP